MRITQLVLSDHWAGVENHVALLSRELVALGAIVHLVCGAENTRLHEAASAYDLPVYPLQLGRGNLPTDWAATYRAAIGWGAQIVHAHLGNSLLCGAAVTAGRHVPLVFTQHFMQSAYRDAPGWRGRARHAAHTLVHRRIDQAITTTPAVRDQMVRHEGFSPQRTTVIPLGIDLEAVAAHTASPDRDLRAELGLAPDSILVVTPARLEREKGHETLLNALQDVLPLWPAVQVLLAGSGSLEGILRTQVARLGLERRIHFLGYRSDVPRLLRAATICVLPSYQESFGLVLVEAMAAGIPAIACAVDGPRYVIADGETGLLVPPRDPGAMAAALHTLLADPLRAAAMGAAGQERARAHFTARAMAEATLDVYAAARAGTAMHAP